MFALITVSKEFGLNLKDHEIAAHIAKVGGGAPSHACVAGWRKTFADDPHWYPGKTKEDRKRPGPKPKFTQQKKRAVASAAMALKRQGVEPSYDEVVARAPAASRNPETGEPYTKKYIMDVFKTLCHDGDPTDPWGHMVPYQKTALAPDIILARHAWGRKMKSLAHPGAWYFRNVIWADPCSTIIPGGPRTAFQQGVARKGKAKRWMAKSSRQYSRNLRAAPYATKQKQHGDGKLWWFVVLARGVVKLHIMDDTWEQTGAPAASVDLAPSGVGNGFRFQIFFVFEICILRFRLTLRCAEITCFGFVLQHSMGSFFPLPFPVAPSPLRLGRR